MYARREQSSDKERRAALDARYRAPLMAFFLRRLGERAEAEDMVQEVFVRMLARGEDEVRSADAFVFTIAANLLRDRGRMAVTHSASAHDPVEALHEREAVDASLVEHCAPERVLLGKEQLAQVGRALAELAPRTRHIFILYRMEAMQRRQIAALYGITVSAVEKHIAKALDHLMKRLER